MKTLICSTIALVGMFAFGQYQEGDTNIVLTVGDRTITRGELQEKIRRHQAKRHGGIVIEKNSAKGYFAVLNVQSRVGMHEISCLAPMIDKWLRFRTLFKEASDISDINIGNIKAKLTEVGGTIGIAVVDSDEFPALLAAPEDGWAIVNVGRLSVDNPSQEVLSSRVRKEVLRGMAFVTGCAYMTKGDPLMRDVKTVADLDHLPVEQFGLEIVNHILESAKFYGLYPWNRTTYKKACQEGWAPAPTNDVQKAIWDSVHALPTAPLKIKPETKKVKE